MLLLLPLNVALFLSLPGEGGLCQGIALRHSCLTNHQFHRYTTQKRENSLLYSSACSTLQSVRPLTTLSSELFIYEMSPILLSFFQPGREVRGR